MVGIALPKPEEASAGLQTVLIYQFHKSNRGIRQTMHWQSFSHKIYQPNIPTAPIMIHGMKDGPNQLSHKDTNALQYTKRIYM